MRKSIAIGLFWVGVGAGLAACSDHGAEAPRPAARTALQQSTPAARPLGEAGATAGSAAAFGDSLAPASGPVSAAVLSPLPAPKGSADRQRPPDAALTTPLPVDDTAGPWAAELHAAKDRALRSLGVAAIWAQWDEVLARGNARETGILLAALGDALHGADPAAAVPVYDGIAARLNDPQTLTEERESLIEVLRHASTAPSLALLLDALQRMPEPTGDAAPDLDRALVRSRMRDAVGAITSGADGRGPNRALSPVLEDAWKGLGAGGAVDDLHLIGQGLAAVGAPSGVSALIERASDPGAEPLAQVVALDAIGRITRIDPIPVMQEALRRADADPRLRMALWNGLVSIGAADAATALLADLAAVPDLTDEQVAQLGTVMTSRRFPDESLKVFNDALRSGQVRDERLRALLTTLNQARSQGATATATAEGGGKPGG